MSYAPFYALIKNLPIDKEEIILQFTEGRTSSLRELSTQEYDTLLAQLRVMSQTPQQQSDKLRKAIISIFHKMDYKDAPDAAKKWAEKMGVGAKEERVCKPFNEYTNQELKKLIFKAELALRDYNKGIRRHLSQ